MDNTTNTAMSAGSKITLGLVFLASVAGSAYLGYSLSKKDGASQSSELVSAPTALKTNDPKCAVMSKTVNGVKIPEARMQFLIAQAIKQGKPAPSAEECSNMIDNLVATEVLAQIAKQQNLQATPDVQAELEMTQQTTLARSAVAAYLEKNKVTDEKAKAYFDKMAADMSQLFRASHILVKTEAEAMAALAEIKAGKPFAEVAKERSLDGSKETGGDLDWSPASKYVPEFAAALKTLKKGEMTQKPVKTQFGYHIIYLADTKTEASNVPPFDQVKEQVKQEMQKELVNKFVENSQKAAKVE